MPFCKHNNFFVCQITVKPFWRYFQQQIQHLWVWQMHITQLKRQHWEQPWPSLFTITVTVLAARPWIVRDILISQMRNYEGKKKKHVLETNTLDLLHCNSYAFPPWAGSMAALPPQTALSSGQCAHTPETEQSVQGMVQGKPPALRSRIPGLTTHPTITDFHGGYKELSYSRHTDQQEKKSPLWRFKKRRVICEALTDNWIDFQGLKIKSARLTGQSVESEPKVSYSWALRLSCFCFFLIPLHKRSSMNAWKTGLDSPRQRHGPDSPCPRV